MPLHRGGVDALHLVLVLPPAEDGFRCPKANSVVDDGGTSDAAALGDRDAAREGELQAAVLVEHRYHVLLPLVEVLPRVVAALFNDDDGVPLLSQLPCEDCPAGSRPDHADIHGLARRAIHALALNYHL